MQNSTLPILLINANSDQLSQLVGVLQRNQFDNLLTVDTVQAGLGFLKSKEIGLVILELDLRQEGALASLSEITSSAPLSPVIVTGLTAELSDVVDCMKHGAFDVIPGPVDPTRLIGTMVRGLEFHDLRRENDQLKFMGARNYGLKNPDAFEGMVTSNPQLKAVMQYVEALAPTGEPLLLIGEEGVGKEQMAEAVHKIRGNQGSYIKLNAADLHPLDFMDDLQTKIGQLANEFSTIYLADIADLPAESQQGLFKLLSEQDDIRQGRREGRMLPSFVMASRTDLNVPMEQGRFSKELYYRLFANRVDMPPLRQRREDLPILVERFAEESSKFLGRKRVRIPKELYPLLEAYNFPGNVNELKRLIYEGVKLSKTSRFSVHSFKKILNQKIAEAPMIMEGFVLNTLNLKDAKKEVVKEALVRSNYNQSQAAEILGFTRQALSQYMKNNGLEKI